MRSAFIDKLIKRMDRLEPGEVQGIVLELARAAVPFAIVLLIVLGVITFVPWLSLVFVPPD